jgi:hypothetical protein
MGRSKKSAWLEGPGDLTEAEVQDVPVKGESILVRGLPAAYSNRAQSEALELKQMGRDTITTINTDRLEVLQFAHGCVDPQFTPEEAKVVSERFGPAFKKVIAEIDRLSGIDKEAIDEANARFQGSREGADGPELGDAASTGSDGSAVPTRAGAPVGNASR